MAYSLRRVDLTAGRASRLAGNVTLAVATGAGSVTQDPLTFAIQFARRFPGARSTLKTMSRSLAGVDRDLAQTWLSGDLVAVRRELTALTRRRALSRLAAEIAQAAGLPELVADDPRIRATTRARAAWQLGEASRAIAMLADEHPGSRLHRVLRSELALMTPGTRLRWSPPPVAATSPTKTTGVLHLLTNSFPHTQSGYTVRSHAVLRAQRSAGLAPVAMTRVGYPVIVGGLDAAALDVVDGIEYHRALPRRLAATPDGRLAQQASAMLSLSTRVRPHVLQTTTNYPNAVVVREVAEHLRLPWAYEVRGMLEQTWVASLGSDEARARAGASERFRLIREREAELASTADAVFTLSDGMQDDLAARGVERARIHVAPNGVESALLERTPAEPTDARASLGLPRDGFWVGSASSLVDYEGFDVLLEAVAITRADGHDVRVLLIGDGTARKGLESQAAALHLGGVAHFTGRVPRDAVTKYREALDLVIVPRLDREVTRSVAPLKPVEAMASGRPLLVSALPPLLEIVGPALAARGASVPPGDARALSKAIARMRSDERSRLEMTALGEARASSRTWDALGHVYAGVLLALGK